MLLYFTENFFFGFPLFKRLMYILFILLCKNSLEKIIIALKNVVLVKSCLEKYVAEINKQTVFELMDTELYSIILCTIIFIFGKEHIWNKKTYLCN